MAFLLKLLLVFATIDTNIGFSEKRLFCSPKIGKIAENCDHT
jgi:hypothetical protein